MTAAELQLGDINLIPAKNDGHIADEALVADINNSSAADVLDETYTSYAAYEARKAHAAMIAGRVATPPYVPHETPTPDGHDPFVFVEQLKRVAKKYGSKTEIVVMEVATASDNTAESIQNRLRKLDRDFVNPLLITLDLLPPSLVDEAQLERREQIRGTIAELGIPSLIIVGPQTNKSN